MKALDISERLGGAAPAGDAEAEPPQCRRGVAAEHAKSHDPDGDRARRRLLVLAPDALVLLRVVEALTAVMHQDVQHDVLGHPHGEIGIDDAHDRHIRQVGIGDDMIDAGTE